MTRLFCVGVLATAWGAYAQSQPPLTLRPDGSFTIAQFADLHFGEAENTLWGPEQDANSTRVMHAVLTAEAPDFVVLSGDQVTGNNVQTNATAYWQQSWQPLVDSNTPFCTVFGNHDDAPFQSASTATAAVAERVASVTTRQQLVAFETAATPLSYTRAGPAALHGVSNYYLLIHDSVNTSKPVFILYFSDSGGGSYNETLFPDQVSWLVSTSDALAAAYGPLPSLLFVHIPPPEYAAAFQPPSPAPGAPCFGALADDGITPTVGPNSLVAAVLATPSLNTSVHAISVGHDHGNAWCCTWPQPPQQQPQQVQQQEQEQVAAGAAGSPLYLCYGRHTGYGGYGDWDRGARMFRLQQQQQQQQQQEGSTSVIAVSSWIRMENGTINSMHSL